MCKEALGRLTDLGILAQVAKTHKSFDVRRYALGVRETAVSEITDQEFLAYIAKNDEIASVRKTAVRGLTDRVLLAEIARTDEDSEVRKAAARQATAPALLAGIAPNA